MAWTFTLSSQGVRFWQRSLSALHGVPLRKLTFENEGRYIAARSSAGLHYCAAPDLFRREFLRYAQEPEEHGANGDEDDQRHHHGQGDGASSPPNIADVNAET
jgi:hypothetical protein